MRAVNLLPPSERPRQVAEVPRNASVAVIAVLGLLLLGVAGYVFTKNQVTDRRDAISAANEEKAAAEQRSGALKGFGDFSRVKQTRLDSVTRLAGRRFDWERLMRELALVLPKDVWLTDVKSGAAEAENAQAQSGSSGQTGSPSQSAPDAGGAGGEDRELQVNGCAPSQKAVAATMVRLRTLYAARDVTLQDSSAAGAEEDGAGSGEGGGEGGGCSKYAFEATVAFAPPSATAKPVKATPRLGGGA